MGKVDSERTGVKERRTILFVEEGVKCPVCGSLKVEGANFCYKCRYAFVECTVCGHYLSQGCCQNCGASVTGMFGE